MTNRELKQWIANLLHLHRACLADAGVRLTLDTVWHYYCENSDDTYVNVCDAFRAAGYDIER